MNAPEQIMSIERHKELQAAEQKTKAREAFKETIQNYMSECEENPNFAGFQIYEERNTETKELLSIKLVACDECAGIVAPRISTEN